MFPPARLPSVLPQPPDLGGPHPASNEEAVSRLWLAAAAPLALARVGHLNLVSELGPYRHAPREELVVVAGQGISRAAELLSPRASS